MTSTKLRAFHSDPKIKAKYVKRVREHMKADEIIKGIYWEDGKGCAVGCTIEGDQHSRYETELGIPEIIARLEDRIFEGLNNAEAKEFPLKFLKAITPGADLSFVTSHFFVWLLTNPENGVARFATGDGKKAIERVVDLYKKQIDGKRVTKAQWQSAYAYAAYDAASRDDCSSCDNCASNNTAAADDYDADHESAVHATSFAAGFAAHYAVAAGFDIPHYAKMADKLIELLRAAK